MKVGDKVIILRGIYKGTITTVKHVTKNGRWIFVNNYYKERYWSRNVEKVDFPNGFDATGITYPCPTVLAITKALVGE